MIEFNNVSKSFPLYHSIHSGLKSFLFNMPSALRTLRESRFLALNNISFSVPQGQTVGVIGRNGSGKSTLLGLVSKVLAPTSGIVTINAPVSPMLELGGGFHPDLSGRENILLNGVLLGFSRLAVRKQLEAIIEFSELEEFIDEPIRIYSSGMLAKLGFSIITKLDPKILVIDEVLAVGDIKFQNKCLDLIQRYKSNGVTILFVSHNLSEVEKICDRAIWIDNHIIRGDGEPDAIINEYTEALKAI